MGTGLSKNIVVVIVAWLCCGMCFSCTCGKKEAPAETKSLQQAVAPNQAPAPDAAAPGVPQPEATAETATPVTPQNQAPASASPADLTQVPEVTAADLADPRLEGLPERTKYVLKALKKAQQRMPAPQVRAHERTSPPSGPE